MLDGDTIRAEFARYLTAEADKRQSLDAALMRVVEMAYRQGIADARGEQLIVVEIDGARLPVTERGTDFRTWQRGNLERLAADLTRRMVAEARKQHDTTTE